MLTLTCKQTSAGKYIVTLIEKVRLSQAEKELFPLATGEQSHILEGWKKSDIWRSIRSNWGGERLFVTSTGKTITV